jgi:hypothetical protein
MVQRNARPMMTATAAAALLITFLIALLTAACASSTEIKTSVSLDAATHRATINYRTGGAFAMTVLFLTYPDGHREMLGKGNIGSGGASLGTGELLLGDYTYTVYWVPQKDQDSDSVSAETLVADGQAVSGKFSVE